LDRVSKHLSLEEKIMKVMVKKEQPRWVYLEAGHRIIVTQGNLWFVDQQGKDITLRAGEQWTVGFSQKYLLSTFAPKAVVLAQRPQEAQTPRERKAQRPKFFWAGEEAVILL
jgi:hypothetical protein